MPIFEYQCRACGRITSALVLNTASSESGEKPAGGGDVRCASCGGDDLVRIMSRFAIHKTESQRMKELDTGASRDDTFYKDSRNVGLWAKKRAQELGTDLGPQFEETVEKARTGKILEDYEG